MFGGTDFIISVRDELGAMGDAIGAVCRLWSAIVLEDAETGEVITSYGGEREVLAYRDSEAARLWREVGADPSLDGTLIHLLLSPGKPTVVVDDVPSPEIASFVESLRAALEVPTRE